MSSTLLFNVNMSCSACKPAIRNALKNSKVSLLNIFMDVTEEKLEVIVEDHQSIEEVNSEVIRCLENFGFTCEPVKSEEDGIDGRVWSIAKGVFGIVIGVGIMALMLSGLAIPAYASYLIVFGCSGLTLLLGAESYIDAVKKMFFAKKLTMDTLFAISTLTVIGVSIASLFVPWLHCMAEAGLMIFGFRHVGKAIEKSLHKKINRGLSFTESFPTKVKKKNGEDWIDFNTWALEANDVIRINTGETIPVDGICLDENSIVLKTSINGCDDDVCIIKGDAVLSGMTAITPMEIKVSKPASDSYLARLRDAAKAAIRSRPAPLETYAEKILQYFILAILGIAIVSAILVGIFFTPALALQCVALLLVSACPCGIGMVIPWAAKTGMTKAYKECHVQFKTSEDLENANNIDTVVFDLNGTLTKGINEVKGHVIHDESQCTENDFVSILAFMEEGCEHSIGKAIHAYASNLYPDTKGMDVTAVNILPSGGIKAEINHQEYLLGNSTLLEENGVKVPKRPGINPAMQIIYLVRNNKVLGHVEIEDPLRPEAEFVVREVKKMKKIVHLCTGNNEQRAIFFAKKLRIPVINVCANATAEEIDGRVSKQAYISRLQEQGKRVAMVGDALNDLPAIGKSNFGIAMKSGALETQQIAGATISTHSLIPVLSAFSISKQTVNNIKQNIIFSLSYNLAFILIAGSILVGLGFVLHPAIGVGLMIVQMSLILLNQERIRRQSIPHQKQYDEVKRKEELNQSTYRNLYKAGIALKDQAKNENLLPENNISRESENIIQLSEFVMSEPVIDEYVSLATLCTRPI